MTQHTSYSSKQSWLNRFVQPTVAQIRRELSDNAANLLDALRKHIRMLDGVTEEFKWFGDCWHWTIVYHASGSEEPLAVVIPSPTDLQLAIPLDRGFIDSLPMKRLKRPVRDGLELAQEPFDTRWGVWSVTGMSMLDDLEDLVEMKLRHLAKRAG